MWVDTHCHLDFPAFDDDRTQVIDDSREVGVEHFVVPGTSPRSWHTTAELPRRYENVHVAYGIHPHFLPQLSDEEVTGAIDALAERCADAACVAVGECGLDALVCKENPQHWDRQLRVFELQVQIAVELGMPLIVHVVRAHGPALQCLRRSGVTNGGVIHSYSGSLESAREYAGMGFVFGFGGAVTRQNAKRAKEVVSRLSLEQIVLETDSPDQAPEGFLSRNEPRAILQVADAVARLRGVALPELAAATTGNAKRVFRLV